MKINYKRDNAAFEDGGLFEDVRILRDIAYKVERGQESGYILDINGAHVGAWAIDDEF